MAKARARQTGLRVSMDDATDITAHRKAVAAQQKKSLPALRKALKESKGDKAAIVAALQEIHDTHGHAEYKRALSEMNTIYKGIDNIREDLNAKRGPR